MTKPISNVTANSCRIVLLGASNLSLSWPRITTVIGEKFCGETSIYTAHGMGRSYLMARSAFGPWQRPGILRCGIWNALAAECRTPNQTFVLITDLGNDLLYGCDSEAVAKAAEEAINRFQNLSTNCQIILTGPPVESVTELGRFRFAVARRLLFPLTQLTLKSAKEQTVDLDHRLQSLDEREGVSYIQPNPDWYGLDPIHIRRRLQHAAFSRIFDLWQIKTGADSAKNYPIPNRRPHPEERWFFGKLQTTPQPVVTVNGVSVAAY